MTAQDRVVVTIPLLVVETREDIPQGTFDWIFFYNNQADVIVGEKARLAFDVINPPTLVVRLNDVLATAETVLVIFPQIQDLETMCHRLRMVRNPTNLTIAFAPRIWSNRDD